MYKKIVITFFILSMGLLGTLSPVFAQTEYTIKEMTPQVQAALENRRARFETLRQYKAQGSIGENNRGYVEALTEDAEAQALAKAENADRKVIYQAIADQNGLTDAIATIESVFAQVQRDKAATGDKIQNENGEWTVK